MNLLDMRNVLRLFILICAAFPYVASAQAYVPVIDINMEVMFPKIMVDNQDSIRNIIAAPDPGGVSKEDCAIGSSRDIKTGGVENTSPIFGYEDGPWAEAYKVSQTVDPDNALPDPGPGSGQPSAYFQENPPQEITSGSLRCLLEQQIEFQKLQLNLQIHDMLRAYISDAQNYLLTKQLSAKIAAANTEYIKTGQETCTTDQLGHEVCTHRSLGNSDQASYLQERKANVAQNRLDQATNDTDNAQGSLDLSPAHRLWVAQQATQLNRSAIEDPSLYAKESTSYSSDLASGGEDAPFNDASTDEDAFFSAGGMSSEGNRLGGGPALWAAINDDSMSPLGSLSTVDNIIKDDVANEQTLQEQKIAQGNGYLPDEECSNTPSDPRCVSRTTVSQGNLISSFAHDYAAQGDKAIAEATALDQQVGSTSQQESSEIVQGGLENYETQALQQTDVHNAYQSLVKEFHDVITYGYWGVKGGTNNWADATMLMIYDVMAQRELPEVNIPTGQSGNEGIPIP